MTADESRSLADQAAEWVPPWARAAPADPVEAESAVVAESAVEVPDGAEVAAAVDGDEAAGGFDGSGEGMPAASAETMVDLPSPPVDSLTADRPASMEVAPEPAAGSVDEPAELPELSDEALRGALEAILLVVDEPTAEIVLAQVLEQPIPRVTAMLDALCRQYTEMGRGFELRRVAGGWRLYTRPEYAAYVERFVLDGQQVRLTQAALETLAVVAYKQPVTRSRISAIRGVNCDGVVRTLVARGLIEECGSEPDNGAFLYRTTTLFLEKLGLDSVDQLPPLAPFLPDDVDEIADAQH